MKPSRKIPLAPIMIIGTVFLLSCPVARPAGPGAGTPGSPAGAPNAPSGLRTGRIDYTGVSLFWNDESSNETGFTFQYSASPDFSGAQSIAMDPGFTGYRVNGLSPGTEYHFRVSAFNASGASAWAQAVSARTMEESAVPRTTYFLSTGGDDSNPGTRAQPWKNFDKAYAAMRSGDTLIIGDGTYRASLFSSYGSGLPSGSPSFYTTAKAEHDFKVTIDGSQLPEFTSALQMAEASYIRVEGMKFKSSRTRSNMAPGQLDQSDHIKILRCSFSDASDHGNIIAMSVGTGCSYVLLEDCWAWGTGRYKFMAFGDQGSSGANRHVIFRRCVARHDYHDPDDWGWQSATFTLYTASDWLLQDCISIDSGDVDPSKFGTVWGGIWMENKNDTGFANSGKVKDCIVLNVTSLAAINDPKINGTREISNCAIWNCRGGVFSGGMGDVKGTRAYPTASLDHLTIGNIWGAFQDESYAWGTGAYADDVLSSATIRNSRIFRCASYGLANHYSSDYDNFFSNAATFGSTYGTNPPVAGMNDSFSDSGQLYLCRTEAGTSLKGRASDGGDVGATILYRRGVSGTLYGEPGYDDLTTDPLWPFPNEAEIKSDMGSYDYRNDGRRGFCADRNGLNGRPLTLTSYIWESMGNACPDGIYGP